MGGIHLELEQPATRNHHLRESAALGHVLTFVGERMMEAKLARPLFLQEDPCLRRRFRHEHLAARLVLKRASKREALGRAHVLACPRTGGFRILGWWRTVRGDVLVERGGGGDLVSKTRRLDLLDEVRRWTCPVEADERLVRDRVVRLGLDMLDWLCPDEVIWRETKEEGAWPGVSEVDVATTREIALVNYCPFVLALVALGMACFRSSCSLRRRMGCIRSG